MSYCRWSSDGFRCDLYCYEDVNGGFTTHVASSRYPEGGPEAPSMQDIIDGDGSAYAAKRAAWSAWRDGVDMVPIGLPFDGSSFNDPDLSSFLARIEGLKSAGYRVPDYVAESIREQMKAVA